MCETLATKPDDLSSAHMVAGENRLPQVVSWPKFKTREIFFVWGWELIPAMTMNVYLMKMGQNKPLGRIWKQNSVEIIIPDCYRLLLMVFTSCMEILAFWFLAAEGSLVCGGCETLQGLRVPTFFHLEAERWDSFQRPTWEAIVWVTTAGPGSKEQYNNFLVVNHQTSANWTNKIYNTAFPPSLSEI